MEKSVHEGHRDRVRKDFLLNGFDDNTPPHKILEMLLFYSIPRKDTNEIAHELLKRFGSIANVLDAPAEQLVSVPGVSLNTVALLKLIMPTVRCYLNDKSEKNGRYTNMDDICDFLSNRYIGYTEEVFTLSTFSANGKMLGCDVLARGEVGEVYVSVRSVVETALKRNAVCAVIAHNHPDGTACPSDSDLETTKRIADALNRINIKLLDHIIIVPDDYVSLAQSRCYKNIFL